MASNLQVDPCPETHPSRSSFEQEARPQVETHCQESMIFEAKSLSDKSFFFVRPPEEPDATTVVPREQQRGPKSVPLVPASSVPDVAARFFLLILHFLLPPELNFDCRSPSDSPALPAVPERVPRRPDAPTASAVVFSARSLLPFRHSDSFSHSLFLFFYLKARRYFPRKTSRRTRRAQKKVAFVILRS